MPNAYQMNPFAPSGLAVPPAAGYLDLPAIYVYERELSGDEVVTADVVSIQTDSDFYLRGIVLALSAGTFEFRYADESSYYTSNSLLQSAVLPTNASIPFPVTPQLRYSAGGRITLDITETSGSTNLVQLWFIGTRRFVSPR